MNTHIVVIFLERNARIIKTDNLDPYKHIPGVLIDPDLSAVSGHPPHYWKNEKGKVVPITNEEKVIRDSLWKEMTWNHQELEKVFIRAKREMKLRQMAYATIAAVLILLPVLMFIWMR